MKIFDMHCHSSLSEDCEAPLSDMCLSAIEKGITGIAFTEHVDFNPADKGYGYFNKESYQSSIDEMRSLFGNEIAILKGVEFSEPHLYPHEFKENAEGDWDVIIGSVHMIGDCFVGDFSFDEDFTLEKLNIEYFSLMKDMVSTAGIDVLAHIDFPKRYFGKAAIPEDIVNDILKIIVDRGIALEINTSPLRKGFDESSPHSDLLNLYARLGGQMITLGSDAHYPEDIIADFDIARSLCESISGLVIGYFEKRKFIPA